MILPLVAFARGPFLRYSLTHIQSMFSYIREWWHSIICLQEDRKGLIETDKRIQKAVREE